MTRELRAAAAIALLAAVVFLPYWVYLPLIGAGIVFFPFFWEAIALGLLIDVLYGGGIGSFSALFSPMAFMATLLLVVMLPVRERLRIYA